MNDKPKNQVDQTGLKIDFRLVFIILGLVSVIVFFPHLKTGFTTCDDTTTALTAWNAGESLGHPLKIAKSQGRFNQAINTYMDWMPYIFKSNTVYHTVRLGTVILGIVLFFIVIRLFSRSSVFACLTTLLIVSFLQNNWQHSLMTSYPFVFQFGFCMLLISFYSFYHFNMTGKKLWASVYGVCYLFSLFVSELFVLYSVIFLIASIGYAWGSEKKMFFTCVFRLILPAFLSLTFFICCMFIFSMGYPGDYDGTKLADISMTAIIRVIAQLSVGTIPTVLYLTDSMTINTTFDGFSNHYVGFLPLLGRLKVQWLVKGILTSWCCWYLLKEPGDIRTSPGWIFKMIFIGIILMILPFVLLGLTTKYQYWISFGTLAYTPSYFGYFGTILTLSSILMFFNNRVKKTKIINTVFLVSACSTVFVLSSITDYYNHYVTLDQQLSHLKWTSVDKLIKTVEFDKVPDGSIIYAPSLYRNSRGILKLGRNYWTEYFTLKTKKKITVIQHRKTTRQSTHGESNFYYLKFLQEPKSKNQFILFAQLEK